MRRMKINHENSVLRKRPAPSDHGLYSIFYGFRFGHDQSALAIEGAEANLS